MADRCNGVLRLPLPLDIRCTEDKPHGEHRNGWCRWTDGDDLARYAQPDGGVSRRA